MKKILSLILSAAMVVCLGACGNKSVKPTDTQEPTKMAQEADVDQAVPAENDSVVGIWVYDSFAYDELATNAAEEPQEGEGTIENAESGFETDFGMDDETTAAIMDMLYSGMYFVFNEDGTGSMGIAGIDEGTAEFTYDDVMLHMTVSEELEGTIDEFAENAGSEEIPAEGTDAVEDELTAESFAYVFDGDSLSVEIEDGFSLCFVRSDAIPTESGLASFAEAFNDADFSFDADGEEVFDFAVDNTQG